MLRSIQLGRLFGIGIYVHWTFFLLPIWAFFALRGDFADAPEGGQGLPLLVGEYSFLFLYGFQLALIAGVFSCVVLHELGHALTARYFGIATRDITLYPIGGVARLERMSDRPWEEFWIAIGGPAVNVAIVALLIMAGLTAVLLGFAERLFASPLGLYLLVLGAANVFLIVFNMLPAFPMDGGRVFRALLSLWLGQLRATRIAAFLGVIMSVVFAVVGTGLAALLLGLTPQPHLILVLIAGFILFAGQMELRAVEYRHREAEGVVPVRTPSRIVETELVDARPTQTSAYESVFGYTPRVAVYTWDHEAGIWVKEPSTP